MDIFYSIAAARLVFILGIVNFITGLLLILSCRCFAGFSLGHSLMKYPGFQKFFKFHCYLWWIFWPSVVIHIIFAVGRSSIPF